MVTTIEAGVPQHLLTFDSFKAVFGERIYPDVLEDTVILPAVAFQVVSVAESLTHGQGQGQKRYRVRVQFDVHTDTRLQAAEYTQVLRDCLRPNGFTFGRVRVDSIHLANSIGAFTPQFVDKHRQTVDFFMSYTGD